MSETVTFRRRDARTRKWVKRLMLGSIVVYLIYGSIIVSL